MLYIAVPKEIQDYEEKVMMGLSGRKLIFVALGVFFAAGIGIGGYFLGLSTDITLYPAAIIGVGFFMLAFGSYHDLPFDRVVYLYIKYKSSKQIVLYQNDCDKNEKGFYPRKEIEPHERKKGIKNKILRKSKRKVKEAEN